MKNNLNYFMTTKRIGFFKWNKEDLNEAQTLWGDQDVTHYISASGSFTKEEIKKRLLLEIQNEQRYEMQYWPMTLLGKQDFIGCCGLRPFPEEKNCAELGFHILKQYWGSGYAFEAAAKVCEYGFEHLHLNKIIAGHHPENKASKRVLEKLDFCYVGDRFYDPTGLYHPSYEKNSP